ncbi:MAG: type II secretion system F family protein [Fimbriimonadales bacterium]
MPTFEYQAVNSAGERVSGVVSGGSMEQALTSLSNNGLVVERINQSEHFDESLPPQAVVEPPPRIAERPPGYEQGQGAFGTTVEGPPVGPRGYIATSVVGPLTGGVPPTALAFFYRQFGTMLDAGVPIVQALDTLGKQGHNLKLHHVVKEIRGHVEAGREISAGMQRYPEVFPPLSVSLVRAGEEGGFVALSFKQLADYTDKEIALRNLIRRLTLYPKIVLVTSILIIGGANLLIATLGKESMLSSPLTTWTTWIVLGPLLIGAFLFYKVGLANPRIKYNWDAMLVKMWFGVGKTVHEFAMAKFGMAMAFLYKGGVPVNKAIQLSADACGNEYLRSQIVPASRRLETGAGITETLKSTGAFSPIVMDMVDTGEHTGNLDGMLLRMSSFYEDEAETRAKQIANIFSVILYLCVAVYVAYVVITFFMKLYSGAGAEAGD